MPESKALRYLRTGCLGLGTLVVAWLVFWSVNFTYTKKTKLSEHLVFVDRIEADRSPFTYYLPVPSRWDHSIEERIELDGAPIWRMKGPSEPQYFLRDVDAVLSPDGRHVALVPRIPLAELTILDVPAHKVVDAIDPPNDSGHDFYGRWLRFLHWSPDSRSLVTAHDDFDLQEHGVTLRTRDIWNVDALTGEPTRGGRCQVADSTRDNSVPDFAGTECEGVPRPRF